MICASVSELMRFSILGVGFSSAAAAAARESSCGSITAGGSLRATLSTTSFFTFKA